MRKKIKKLIHYEFNGPAAADFLICEDVRIIEYDETTALYDH